MDLTKLKIMELKIYGKHATATCFNKPHVVILGVTRKCNFKCVWCQRSQYKNLNDIDLDFDFAKNIVKSISKQTDFHICGLGESLLYGTHKLEDLFNICKSKNKIITTNGSLLNKNVVDRFKEGGVNKIHVSIDTPYNEVFKKIRGFDLEVIKKNISNSKIPIIINMVLSEETKNGFMDMVKLAVKLKVKDIHIQNLREWGGDFHKVKQTPLNVIYVERMKKYAKDHNINTDIDKTLLHGFNGCYQLFTKIYINSEGFVTPCCGWEFKNLLKHDNIMDIWNHPVIISFRKKLIKKQYPAFCQKRCLELRCLKCI